MKGLLRMRLVARLLLSSACLSVSATHALAYKGVCATSNEINANITTMIERMTPDDRRNCQVLERIVRMRAQRLRLIYSDARHCDGEAVIAQLNTQNQQGQRILSELGCPGH